MPIGFPVGPRTIVLCDYSKGGFLPPEMVKRRPVVVLSPRLPHRDGLCAVVPLSGTPPAHPVPYVVPVEFDEPLPAPFSDKNFWAKCDMVATVSLGRLDLFHGERGHDGRRRYLHPKMPADVFEAIQYGVLAGLGLGHLTNSHANRD